ncbi:MAG: methionyl-tRNA formyltransferase [Janthinobacterium lividum]
MTHSLRIAFAGTPEFAAAALTAIDAAGFPVVLVLTQPDRPAGRGMKTVASPVKRVAAELGKPLAQPRSLRLDGKYPDEAAQAIDQLRAQACDVLVVAAYGLLLPANVLNIPRFGCINIHASLLPRWRGAAPIHRAIEAGDTATGITLMQMDEGLDTGAMIASRALPISSNATTGALHDELAALGATMIVDALAELEASAALHATPQPADGVTYAAKISKAEAALDWRQSAALLARRVRAFNPSPGAVATIAGTALKIWSAESVTGATSTEQMPNAAQAAPGTIVDVTDARIVVACGEGLLAIEVLQKAGGTRMAVREFIKGFALHCGQKFDVTEPS